MRLVSRVRDALTGRYTSRAQATARPGSTVSETDTGLRAAAIKLIRAYDAGDTDRADALAAQIEDMRAALGMPPPGFGG